MKYYFRYEGPFASVYYEAATWGEMFVASFKHGIDAQEYVDLKNKEQHNERTNSCI